MEKQDLPIFHKKKLINPLKNTKKLPLFRDRLFTSFRSFEGRVPFLVDHLKRLAEGCSYFYPHEDFAGLENKILEGLERLMAMAHRDLRYRITLYLEADELEFFISTYLLPEALPRCELIRARTPRYPSSVPSNIKWGNNYAEIFHELKWAQEQGLDEVIFFNQEGLITECSTSNIFLIKGDRILTPKPNKCFLTGILRNNLINHLKAEELDLSFEDLKEADEVFLTNSVRGIVPVTKFEDKILKKSSKIPEIYKKMIEANCE
ncbi:MAG: hypothetical protein E2O68_06640 [Deltaproteobacteria bacterium]|nr:MAG: hypothetical protein E2O68_06640 [Deltaproteobacteria bacterium]